MHRQVDAIHMGTHYIYLYQEVDKKNTKVHRLQYEDNEIAWLCVDRGMCGNWVECGYSF